MDTHRAVRTHLDIHPTRWLAIALLAFATGCSDSGKATASTGTDPAGSPVGQGQAAVPSTQPGAPAAGVIRGTIVLADGLAAKLPAPLAAYNSLFIIGRRNPDDRMAGLITKVPVRDFPIPFQLDARDMMSPGTMSGAWHLSVRLDSDGDATALEGDVEGICDGPVSAGDTDVQLVLSSVRAEAGNPVLIDGQGGHGAPAERMLAGQAQGKAPHGGMPAGHPPVSAGTLPATPADPAPAAHGGAPTGQPARIPGPRIQGTISMDEAFAGSAGVLYIMVKAQVGPRMPRVVMRVDAPSFPLEFDMGPEHVPLQVENKADMLVGDLVISARLDADGNAMTKGPQDVETETLPVVPDGDAVSLVLDRRGQ